MLDGGVATNDQEETTDAHVQMMKAAGIFTETINRGELSMASMSQSCSTTSVASSSVSSSSAQGGKEQARASSVPSSSTSRSSTGSVRKPMVASSEVSSSSRGVTVHLAKTNTSNGQRVYDKQMNCKFCDVLSTNLCKHLFSKIHQNEPEIAEILSKPKKSKEREWLLEKVRNQGNYQHNCRVLEVQEGILIPWRSPTQPVDPSNYIPCTFCLGFFLRKELWRHEHSCKFKTETKKGRRVIGRAESLLPSKISCSQGFREDIIASMHSDEITQIAKNDLVITRYGEKLYQKYGHTESKRGFIRQKIRELARFLQAARKVDSDITGLDSCLIPNKFPQVVLAAKRLCSYDGVRNIYGNPSLAVKLGHSIKKCAGIVRNQALMSGDAEIQKTSACFRELCESEWKDISSCALSTLEGRKYNKPHVLPLTEDLKKVTNYLGENRKKCLSALRSNPTSSTWLNLAKVCLANIIMFNRRRSGEASRMLVSNFEDARNNCQPSDDILAALSEMEKQLVNSFFRVEVPGKRGRKVPILFTAAMKDEVEELLRTRERVGVNVDNKYVFARPNFGSENYIEGHTCLHEAVEESGAACPQNITSTKLRKHLATVSQILNLTEHELEQVCGFLGHNISVHRDFYRLPQDTFQLAKVSRLLIAAENGQIAQFQGKSLEDIQLEQDLEFDKSEFEENDISEAEGEPTRMEPAESDEEPTRIEPAESDEEPTRIEPAESKKKTKKTELVQGENSKHRRPEKRKNASQDYASTETFVGKRKDFLYSHQADLIRCHFKAHIDRYAVPKKAECEDLIKKEPTLHNKTWLKIKCTVRNEIEKKKREVRKLQNRKY